MSSIFGNRFKISVFENGAVIEGLPAGLTLKISENMPGKILSGVNGGKTTGAPLCAVLNEASAAYTAPVARPGYPDYTYFVKYKTTGAQYPYEFAILFAGAVAKEILKAENIRFISHIKSIGEIEDTPLSELPLTRETADKILHGKLPVYDSRKEMLMTLRINQAKNNLDTIGGQAECAVIGLSAGLGEPLFHGIQSQLSALLFSLPEVCGIEFGKGFAAGQMNGSDYNDSFFMDTLNGTVATKTNHAGGVQGGITNGMPLIFNVAFAPAPDIGIEQQTVDFQKRHSVILPPSREFDACKMEQKVLLTESAAAIVLADAILQNDS